ncbi:MAG: hypothetical protein AAF353_13290, partial [Pseudomonadota bacterium]
DREEILRLWRHLPGEFPPQNEKLDWFYGQNPAGRGTVYFLDYKPEKRPVGIVCLCPRHFLVTGRVLRGAVFADFVIEPEHRSLGPALWFQKAFLERATETFELLYGFPNALSGPVRSFGGYSLNYELNLFVLPLNFSIFLSRKTPGFISIPVGSLMNWVSCGFYALRKAWPGKNYISCHFDSDFIQELWRSQSGLISQLGFRDPDFIKWRLEQHPNYEFDFLALRDPKNNTPLAYAALRIGENKAVVVEDFYCVSTRGFEAILLELTARFAGRARSISFTVPLYNKIVTKILSQYYFQSRGSMSAFVSLGKKLDSDIQLESIWITTIDNDV